MPMKRILVVDDDPYILMSLEFVMKKAGHDVMIARNGAEAVEAINSFHPHLLLLDVMMPDVDGFSICRYIKANEKTKDIIVVFISARTQETDIEKGLQLGAARYICKPFSTRDIARHINELLAE